MYTTRYNAQVLFKSGSIAQVSFEVPDGMTPQEAWSELPHLGSFITTEDGMIQIADIDAIVFSQVQSEEE